MLHAPTALALGFSIALSCGFVLTLLWWQDRRRVALRNWGASHILTAFCMPFFALRGQIPDALSIDLPNAMILLGFGLLWSGMRHFVGRPAPPAAALAGVAVWLVACRFPSFYAEVSHRVVLMSLLSAAYILACAREAWRDPGGSGVDRLRSQALMAGLLALYGVTYLARIPVSILAPPRMAQGFPGDTAFAALIMASSAMAGTVALVLVALLREQDARDAQRALTAAAALADRANAGKTRFLAHLSHELRTPLNGVLGLAQALAADPGLQGEPRERARLLERSGRHLNALLNDVLDLSSIEAGRLELVPVPTPLLPLLEDVSALARAAAEAKGVSLRLEAAEDLPPAVRGDALRLRQILHNLLGNAVKFTPPGGQVRLDARRGEAGQLVLEVTDDGPGVPEDFREHLFQDYTRSTREAAKGDGTGLGLAISAGLARAMEGGIRFGTGRGGHGSVFTVTLPLAECAPPGPPPPAEPDAVLRRLRVLVVDDVAVNRLVLRAMLERAGHEVREASDGSEALALLAAASAPLEREDTPDAEMPLPDLVLMDVLMPGMDGLEATRRIRTLHGPVAALPIIAVTAGVLPGQAAECLEAGMDGHLPKPVDRGRLFDLLEGVVQQRMAVGA